MKQLDIRHLIGETTEYDKKQALEVKKPKSWCKSVSAFANGIGGKLVWGIADDSIHKDTISEKFRNRHPDINWLVAEDMRTIRVHKRVHKRTDRVHNRVHKRTDRGGR